LAYHNVSLCFTGTSNFINNSANVEGGAVAADDNTSLSFTGTSNFINNSVDSKGGGAVAGTATLSTTQQVMMVVLFLQDTIHH